MKTWHRALIAFVAATVFGCSANRQPPPGVAPDAVFGGGTDEGWWARCTSVTKGDLPPASQLQLNYATIADCQVWRSYDGKLVAQGLFSAQPWKGPAPRAGSNLLRGRSYSYDGSIAFDDGKRYGPTEQTSYPLAPHHAAIAKANHDESRTVLCVGPRDVTPLRVVHCRVFSVDGKEMQTGLFRSNRPLRGGAANTIGSFYQSFDGVTLVVDEATRLTKQSPAQPSVAADTSLGSEM